MLHRPSSEGTIVISQPAHAGCPARSPVPGPSRSSPGKRCAWVPSSTTSPGSDGARSRARSGDRAAVHVLGAAAASPARALVGSRRPSRAAVALRRAPRLAARHPAGRALSAGRRRGRAACARRLPRARARLSGPHRRVAATRFALQPPRDAGGTGTKPGADLRLGRAVARSSARRHQGADGGGPYARAVGGRSVESLGLAVAVPGAGGDAGQRGPTPHGDLRERGRPAPGVAKAPWRTITAKLVPA